MYVYNNNKYVPVVLVQACGQIKNKNIGDKTMEIRCAMRFVAV